MCLCRHVYRDNHGHGKGDKIENIMMYDSEVLHSVHDDNRLQ